MSAEDGQIRSELAMPLVPGCRVFVVLHKDPLRERIDVRTSMVLHQEEDVLFLAQTEPPVTRAQSGANIEVATLCPDDSGLKRPVSYVARLLDVREDYPLEDRVTLVQALAVSAPVPGDFFETSLRMHHRVPVDEEMNVVIRLEGHEDVELLDFSAGGARVRVGLHAPEAGLAPEPEAAEPDAELVAAPEPADLEPADPESGATEPDAGPEADAEPFALGRSIPFRLVFLGSGFAEGDGVVRSAAVAEDGASVILGLFFTNMEIRDIRYLERMVARTVTTCRQRERDAEYV